MINQLPDPSDPNFSDCLSDLLRSNDESSEINGRTALVGHFFWLSKLNASDVTDQEAKDDVGKLGLPRTIGRFRLDSLIGRGGFGAVFRAYDNHLDRYIALKLAWPKVLLHPGASKRFIDEARIAAQLNIPGTVKVYDSGAAEMLCFIALELIDGPTLQEWARVQNRVPFRVAAAIIRNVAESIHYAHQHGIIHRDLKPSNILMRPKLDNSQCPFDPVVTDFGLARRQQIEGPTDLTGKQGIIGTDRYMAPEQASGKSSDVGPLSDVFSMGVILYELVAGVRPFEGEDAEQIRLRIQKDDPPPLRIYRSGCPKELEAIIQKCLAKASERRYPSAGEFANDLRRFLAGEPVHARFPGPIRRTWKFIGRHPVGFAGAITATIAALVLTGLAGAILADRRAAAERIEIATAAKSFAEGMERQHQYATEIRYAARSVAQGSQAETMVHLDEAMKLARDPVKKGIEWDILAAMTNDVDHVMPANLFGVRVVRFSPTEDLMISTGSDLRLISWDINTWKPARIALSSSGNYPKAAEFSPDGSLVAVVGEKGRVVVHRTSDQSVIFDRKVIAGTLYALAWYGESKRFAVGGDGGVLVTIDLDKSEIRYSSPIEPSAQSRVVDPNHPNEIAGISYFAERKLLGIVKAPPELVLIEPDSLSEVERWADEHCMPGDGTICPNMIRPNIAAVAGANHLRLCDIRDGKTVASIEVHSFVENIQYSAKAGLLVGCFRDGSVETWNAEELLKGRLSNGQIFTGHKGRAHSVDISRDGKWMASGGKDGTVRVWANPDRGQPSETPVTKRPFALQFSPCQRWLAFVQSTSDGQFRTSMFDVVTGRNQWSIDQKFSPNPNTRNRDAKTEEFPISFHPTGNEIAMFAEDASIISRSCATGAVIRTLCPVRPGLRKFYYSPSGKEIVVLGGSPSGMINQGVIEGVRSDVSLIASFLTSDGELWVESDGPRRCILRRSPSSSHLKVISPTVERFTTATLSGDGRLLAGAGMNPVIYLWNIKGDGPPARLIAHDHSIKDLKFSRDSRTLISLDQDGILKCWHTPTRSELLTIGSANEKIICMDLHPSGSIFALGIQRKDRFLLRIYRLGPNSTRFPKTFAVSGAEP